MSQSSIDSYPRSSSISGENDQLFIVSCYSDFDKLAHGPKGTEAENCIYVYRFQASDGSMLLLNVAGDPKEIPNPAFSRFHPRLNVLYTCTEDIEENGQILAYEINSDGELIKIGSVDAGGTSTCYLTIDRDERNLLAVNYWDSSLVTIPISLETGEFTGPVASIYDPKGGKGINAAAKINGGVNHSNNDESTIKMRQADPHSHALVLDPYVGCIAYVPCLGKDLIREFYYDKINGAIETELNFLPSGLCTGHPDGPRYVEFHPTYRTMYVVNELSSTIAVFSVDKDLIREINKAGKNGDDLGRFKGRQTLKLLQSIGTVPCAFPKKMNTCGRLALHKSGRFILVSNRGHQSIAILRVAETGPQRGQLVTIGYFHTRGETPRHFKFDNSGQYLIVANQDTDNISVFSFNQCSGEIKFTGNEYRVPSPNFVCSCSLHDEANAVIPVSDDDSSDSEKEETTLRRYNGRNTTVCNVHTAEKQLEEALAEVEYLKKHINLISIGN